MLKVPTIRQRDGSFDPVRIEFESLIASAHPDKVRNVQWTPL
jgi:hypothetical protein